MVGNTGMQIQSKSRQSFGNYMRQNFWLYIFLIPGMLFLLIFKYLPMGGIVIAFKNYRPAKGIMESAWVGMEHFTYLFNSEVFWRVLRNSLVISLMRLAFGFPMPILLALMMNEMRNQGYKRIMQTILYLPHFISWVIVVGMITNLLSPSTGIINTLYKSMGMDTVDFLTTPAYFRPVLVIADIWKGCGWGTIVYMAAIAGIDPALYEAAVIDGANRVQRIFYVTLPAIAGTIIVMLIMRTGSILNNGFEEIYLLKNALTAEVADVFETYTYEVGLKEGRFSYAAAVGLFQSLVGCIMLFTTNTASRKIGGGGLW